MMSLLKQNLCKIFLKSRSKGEEADSDKYEDTAFSKDSSFLNSYLSDTSDRCVITHSDILGNNSFNQIASQPTDITDDALTQKIITQANIAACNGDSTNASNTNMNALENATTDTITTNTTHAIQLPLGVEKFTLRVEGLDIVGLMAGDTSKPTLVFLHGQYCDAHTWLSQLSCSTLQANYHMLAWSAPGYGQSEPWPHTNPSGLNFALMLKAWLQRQEKQQVILVGHGLGALVASSYAARFVKEVEALILVAPEMGVLRSGRYRRQSSHQDTNTLLTYGKEVFCKEKLKYLMVPRFDALDKEELRQLCITFHLPNDTQFECKLSDEKWLACAKTITQHLLLLDPEAFEIASWTILNEDLESYRRYYHGYSEVWAAQFDRMVKQHDAKRLACRYHSDYKLFVGVGHFFHIEDASLFNEYLLRLTSSIDAYKERQLKSKFNTI